ncbi:unnamed protein product [Prorocentrum cordatum]|uniref:Uncharacterized protein n=1 Tax=Prorocentrum cordatum TaxID=2364126 RepID=A0ABN9T3L5_9DINO|nr:unnamed protein product [Polarella glacialis]
MEESARKRKRTSLASGAASLPDIPSGARSSSLASWERARSGSASCAAQAKLAYEDPFWSLVRTGDAEGIFGEVRARPEVLCERGPEGETPLHMLVLYRHFEVARALAGRYPNLILDQYTGENYKGENCVHIAIVHHSLDFLRFLLETSQKHGSIRKLLSARATGLFFARGQPCYYGETPLGFAVSTNIRRRNIGRS